MRGAVSGAGQPYMEGKKEMVLLTRKRMRFDIVCCRCHQRGHKDVNAAGVACTNKLVGGTGPDGSFTYRPSAGAIARHPGA